MFSKLFNFVFVLAIVLFGFGTLSTNAMEGYGGGAPACTMYANPSTIDYNGGMYLNWDVNENVTYALLHPKGSYSWTMEVSPTDGSWWMSGLRNTRDYTLTVYNENEESADFAFSNALSSGDGEKIITEISTLSNQFGVAMVWNRDIISSIRTLLKVRFALDSPDEKSGIHPFVMSNMSRAVRKFTPEQLQHLHEFLLQVDQKTKTGQLSLSQESAQFLLHIQKELYTFFSK